MSKHQRGNKEAKKPKQPTPAMKPPVPADAAPTLGTVAPRSAQAQMIIERG